MKSLAPTLNELEKMREEVRSLMSRFQAAEEFFESNFPQGKDGHIIPPGWEAAFEEAGRRVDEVVRRMDELTTILSRELPGYSLEWEEEELTNAGRK